MVKKQIVFIIMSLKQGGDREKGLQRRAGDNVRIGGSACGDVHSWRLQQSREKKSPTGDSAGNKEPLETGRPGDAKKTGRGRSFFQKRENHKVS